MSGSAFNGRVGMLILIGFIALVEYRIISYYHLKELRHIDSLIDSVKQDILDIEMSSGDITNNNNNNDNKLNEKAASSTSSVPVTVSNQDKPIAPCLSWLPEERKKQQEFRRGVCLDNNNWNEKDINPFLATFVKSTLLGYREGGYIAPIYRGVDTPPGQMSPEQYLYIALTYMSTPHQHRETLFKQNDRRAYYYIGERLGEKDPRHPSNDRKPNMLFFGCGKDTPLWKHLAESIGGRMVIAENSDVWFEKCRKANDLEVGKDLFFYSSGGDVSKHHRDMDNLWASAKPENNERMIGNRSSFKLSEHLLDKRFKSQEQIKISKELLSIPFDVIVIDGPSGYSPSPGRSLGLYFAARLALSKDPFHVTNIFLHDASRKGELSFANAIMGHHPEQYEGNILPRKGLKLWRVLGENIPMFPFDGPKGIET